MLKRERRAVTGNLRRVSGKRGLALQWKVIGSSILSATSWFPIALSTSHTFATAGHAGGLGGQRRQDRPMLAAGKGSLCGRRMWGIGNSRRGCWQFTAGYVARVVEDKPAEITLRNLMASERLKIVDLKGVCGYDRTLTGLASETRSWRSRETAFISVTPSSAVFFPPTSFPLGLSCFRRSRRARAAVFVIREVGSLPHSDGRIDPGSSVRGHMPRRRCRLVRG